MQTMTVRQLIKLLQSIPEKFKDVPIYYPFHGEYDTSLISIRSIDPILEGGKLSFRFASHNGSTKHLMTVTEELHKRVNRERKEVIKAVKRGFLKTMHKSCPRGPICYFDPAPYSCRKTHDPYEMARNIVRNYIDTNVGRDKTNKWTFTNLPDGQVDIKYCLSDIKVRYEISPVVKNKFKIRWTIHTVRKPVDGWSNLLGRIDPATLYKLIDVYIFNSYYKVYPEYGMIDLIACDDGDDC